MKFIVFIVGFIYYAPLFSQESFKSERTFKRYLSKQIKLADKSKKQDFTKKILPAECQADLRILKYTLEEAQTTLYRYTSPAKVNEAFSNAYEKASDSLYYTEFLTLIGQIQHVIACGHSSWRNDPAYSTYRNKNVGLFPFGLNFHKGHVIIEHNYSRNTAIPEYSALFTVNKRSIDEILDELKQAMTRDGSSNDASNAQALKYFKMAYSNFIGNPSEFEITYRPPDGDLIFKQTVSPLKKPEIDSIQKKRYPNWKKRGRPLKLEIDSASHSALYTIDWFKKEYIYKKGQDFEVFTDSVFAVLAQQKTETLFIDLRGNTGGWTAYGKHLFSYFIDQPVPYMANVVSKKYTDYSFERIKVRDPEYDPPIRMVQNDNGLYEWENYPSLIADLPDSNRFDGNVYIIIDNFTRSCSGMFCSLMREHTNAQFIGEETGATQCGAGGMVAGILLPHSNITVTFSTAKYSCAVKNPENSRGIIPDIPLIRRIKGRDDFQFYLDYIKKL